MCRLPRDWLTDIDFASFDEKNLRRRLHPLQPVIDIPHIEEQPAEKTHFR